MNNINFLVVHQKDLDIQNNQDRWVHVIMIFTYKIKNHKENSDHCQKIRDLFNRIKIINLVQDIMTHNVVLSII